jgi:hypothetical protein
VAPLKAFHDLDARLPKVELTGRRFILGYVLPMALMLVGLVWGWAKLDDQASSNHSLVEQTHALAEQNASLLRRYANLAEANRKTSVAMCATQENIQERVKGTRDVLEQTKGQDMIFGIPRELVAQGLHRDAATLEALQGLECPPPPVPKS